MIKISSPHFDISFVIFKERAFLDRVSFYTVACRLFIFKKPRLWASVRPRRNVASLIRAALIVFPPIHKFSQIKFP